MAIRIILLLIGIILIVNLVIMSVGLIMNVNLYKKYGKQILNFFIILAIAVIFLFVIFSIIGLV